MKRVHASVLVRQLAMSGYWVRAEEADGEWHIYVALPDDETAPQAALISNDLAVIQAWVAEHPING